MAFIRVSGVHLIASPPPRDSPSAVRVLDGLTPADAARLRRKTRWIDEWRSAIGSILCSTAASPLVVGRSHSGRPFVMHNDGTACISRDISLTHHGDWVLVAAAFNAPPSWRIGVDVLRVVDAPGTHDALAQINAFLGPGERAAIAGAPDIVTARFMLCVIWAAKEAFAKAMGHGISRAFATYDIGEANVTAATRALACGRTYTFRSNQTAAPHHDKSLSAAERAPLAARARRCPDVCYFSHAPNARDTSPSIMRGTTTCCDDALCPSCQLLHDSDDCTPPVTNFSASTFLRVLRANNDDRMLHVLAVVLVHKNGNMHANCPGAAGGVIESPMRTALCNPERCGQQCTMMSFDCACLQCVALRAAIGDTAGVSVAHVDISDWMTACPPDSDA